MDAANQRVPLLRQVVLDCTDARELAEFCRRPVGFQYRPGDEPPFSGEPDVKGRDWLVLRNAGGTSLAFHQVDRCSTVHCSR